ncbi:MAG: PA14 domain-containing protein, partial [Acidimicrobiia bacterium]
ASDPNGDQVQYWYRVARYDGPGVGDDAETNVVYDSGWTTASSLTVPAGVLAWNATYTWHVYTYDGVVVTSPNWVWWFSPTNAAPSTPTLSAPPNGATVGLTNPTLSASAADPDGDAVELAFKVSSSPNLTGSLVQSGFGAASWTLPAGALADGRTYYWSAMARDSIGATSAWAAPRSFRVDLRLGVRPSVPYDTLGPVSVNLANGNVVAAMSSPPVAAVGGPLGVSYAYNSYGRPAAGLSGSYFNDDGDRVFNEHATLTRTDAAIDFDWGTASPAPMIGADNFLVRWSGYLTAPAGTYTFGAISDDGVRVWVDNTRVVNRWFDQGASATPIWDGSVDLPSGGAVPIVVEHYEAGLAASLSLWQSGPGGASPVPAGWLSTELPALPDGWSLSADAGGDLAYTEARLGAGEVVLVDATGATSRYTWTGTGWRPPADEDAVVTNDAARGALVVHAGDGRTYAFAHDGRLESVTSPLDPRQPAAPIYTWSGSPLRLAAITDPVSSRAVTLSYG